MATAPARGTRTGENLKCTQGINRATLAAEERGRPPAMDKGRKGQPYTLFKYVLWYGFC